MFFPEAPAKVCSMLPNSPFHFIYVTCIYMSYIFHITYLIYIDSFIYIPLAHTSTASPTSLLRLHPCMVYINFNHQFNVCQIHHLHQLDLHHTYHPHHLHQLQLVNFIYITHTHTIYITYINFHYQLHLHHMHHLHQLYLHHIHNSIYIIHPAVTCIT